MKSKKWKRFHAESCPNCGNNLEVFSESPESNDNEFEQYFSDGEEVRCVSECGFKSAISVDSGEAWVQDGNIDELSDDIINLNPAK